MNTVTLLGRLVADPRVQVTADGLNISEVRVVTNDRQEPEFHDVVTYRRLAELVGEYTRKRSLVLGHLHTISTGRRCASWSRTCIGRTGQADIEPWWHRADGGAGGSR